MSRRSKSRREFLKDVGRAGLAASVVDSIFMSLLKSQSNVAWAQSGAQFTKFLNLNLFGAPPRWSYDLFLNPNNSATAFMPTPMISNGYTGGARFTEPTYRQVRYGKSQTHVPQLWSYMVPTSQGGQVPAWTLLNHLLSIRGINVLSAGHSGASGFHQIAVAGAPSITSVSADRATVSKNNPTSNVIKSIQLNPTGTMPFKSTKNMLTYRYDAQGGINNLAMLFTNLRPVSTASGFNSSFVANQSELESKIEAALTSLEPSAKFYYSSVTETSSSAFKILTDDTVALFSDLQGDWTSLYGKYKDLVDRAKSATYVGLNDKPIGATPQNEADGLRYQYGQDVVSLSKNSKGEIDIREMFNAMDGDDLAAQFAVTEFLLSKDLCPSVQLNARSFSGVRVNGGNSPLIFDQHFVGCMPSILGTSIYYLALTACLIELIDQLKKANKFDSTLIYMASEFNRSPRENGSGSDHGALAAHVNLLSGRQKGFKLIGNILRDASGPGGKHSSVYRGSWGHGTDIGGAPLNIVEVWASTMTLLGYPVANLPSAVDKKRLIFKGNGDLTVNAGFNEAKTVENKG
jgi:Protein of unknown function (DUF1501)